MKVKLSNRSISHNSLRTSDVVGEAPRSPTIGECFVLYAAPIEFEHDGDDSWVRQIITSMVCSVEKTSAGWLFNTLNSKYEAEIV